MYSDDSFLFCYGFVLRISQHVTQRRRVNRSVWCAAQPHEPSPCSIEYRCASFSLEGWLSRLWCIRDCVGKAGYGHRATRYQVDQRLSDTIGISTERHIPTMLQVGIRKECCRVLFPRLQHHYFRGYLRWAFFHM